MKSAENIEKLIKNVDLDIDINTETDRAILGELSEVHEKSKKIKSALVEPKIRRMTMFVRKRTWKVAAVLAVLIGVGAIAVVGVNISKIYYYGKNDDGAHIFLSDDLETVVTTDEVTDVEQTVRDLEEMKILRQQDKRELLKVEEILRDGTIAWKVHEYKYELSDGRTKDMREGVDGTPVYSQDQFKEFKPKLEEFRRLREAGQGEDLGTYEETVKGRVFSFKREKYSLSDGTEVIWSVGTPKDGQ